MSNLVTRGVLEKIEKSLLSKRGGRGWPSFFSENVKIEENCMNERETFLQVGGVVGWLSSKDPEEVAAPQVFNRFPLILFHQM